MMALLVIPVLLIGSAIGGFFLLNYYDGSSNLSYDFILDNKTAKKELLLSYHELNKFSILVDPEPAKSIRNKVSEKWEDIYYYKEKRDGYDYCKTVYLNGNYKKVILIFDGDYTHRKECGGLKVDGRWIVRTWSCDFTDNGPVKREITDLAKDGKIHYCVYANSRVSYSKVKIRGIKIINEQEIVEEYPILKIYKDGKPIFSKKITNKEVIDLTQLTTFSLFDNLRYDKEVKIVLVREGRGKINVKTDITIKDKIGTFLDGVRGVLNGKDN